MNYPLQFSFKIVAIAPQIFVLDASGQTLMYVKQKLFKLKEAINIFADNSQSTLLYTIGADRVIDFSARYHLRDADGNDLGSIKRQGMKSLFKSHWDIYSGEEVTMSVQEDNPWIRFLDALFMQIPLIGMLAGYVFHPKYNVTRANGTRVAQLCKKAALFEGKYELVKHSDLEQTEETRMVLGLLMMMLLQRSRG
ncbi:MAG: hypothetical protein HN348_27815 [Proteobacteria bacterium]|jgi:uncharacterized protein YxjI|nr:hypothetical protein [Pseudomonadota bacterium]